MSNLNDSLHIVSIKGKYKINDIYPLISAHMPENDLIIFRINGRNYTGIVGTDSAVVTPNNFSFNVEVPSDEDGQIVDERVSIQLKTKFTLTDD